ncbi:hypothetical protein CJU90_1632 [Yarrowia sp. C11]|nr:hypothetical protein CKK34_0355 [Yarrowia sp. E02]KAG5371590.1 hypothetical protein CJU90_1632 [Yarrowia sp. C11]
MNAVNQTSIPEIYYLTSRAQMKLTKESVRPDLQLRQLVCHANLVDNLLGELSTRRRNQTMVKLADDVYDSVAVTSSASSSDADEDDSEGLSDSSSDDDEEYMKQPNYTYHPYQQEMLFEDASSEYHGMNPPVYSVITV